MRAALVVRLHPFAVSVLVGIVGSTDAAGLARLAVRAVRPVTVVGDDRAVLVYQRQDASQVIGYWPGGLLGAGVDSVGARHVKTKETLRWGL